MHQTHTQPKLKLPQGDSCTSSPNKPSGWNGHLDSRWPEQGLSIELLTPVLSATDLPEDSWCHSAIYQLEWPYISWGIAPNSCLICWDVVTQAPFWQSLKSRLFQINGHRSGHFRLQGLVEILWLVIKSGLHANEHISEALILVSDNGQAPSFIESLMFSFASLRYFF